MEDVLDYKLFDVVELKKPHPCKNKSKLFQIIALGADVKIVCLGCGNILLLTRDNFNHRIKKIVQHKDSRIIL